MEAVQEARQLQQLRSTWKWLMRTLTIICIAGTIFLAIKPGRIGVRVGGAQPWRWATMISIFLCSKAVLNWILDLVMVALDRKHVVAKRLSFILGGIFDNLVFTLYYIALRIAWGALLRDAAGGGRRGLGGLPPFDSEDLLQPHRVGRHSHGVQGYRALHGGVLSARGVLPADYEGSR